MQDNCPSFWSVYYCLGMKTRRTSLSFKTKSNKSTRKKCFMSLRFISRSCHTMTSLPDSDGPSPLKKKKHIHQKSVTKLLCDIYQADVSTGYERRRVHHHGSCSLSYTKLFHSVTGQFVKAGRVMLSCGSRNSAAP